MTSRRLAVAGEPVETVIPSPRPPHLLAGRRVRGAGRLHHDRQPNRYAAPAAARRHARRRSTKPQRPIRVALALGGGAARGFAHIGVIKALEARNIQVDLVAGTSAGSVVGALYASGMNGFALNKLALTMDEASISDWAMPFRTRGFLQGVALQNYLNTTLNNRPIEKMAKPLGVVATDLRTGQPILFQRGNTGIAVRASCSVPSIFEPVKIGGHEYVDGGLVSPVPASFARKMGADFVIAVDISQRPEAGADRKLVRRADADFHDHGPDHQGLRTRQIRRRRDPPESGRHERQRLLAAQRGDSGRRRSGGEDHAGVAAQAGRARAV